MGNYRGPEDEGIYFTQAEQIERAKKQKLSMASKLAKVEDEKCPDCGSKVEFRTDIGYDINPDYEERQHLQVCRACKKDRFICEVYPFEKEPYVSTGKWNDTDKSFLDMVI